MTTEETTKEKFKFVVNGFEIDLTRKQAEDLSMLILSHSMPVKKFRFVVNGFEVDLTRKQAEDLTATILAQVGGHKTPEQIRTVLQHSSEIPYLQLSTEEETTEKTKHISYGSVILENFEVVANGFDIVLSKMMLERLAGRMFTALQEGEDDTRYSLTVLRDGDIIKVGISTEKIEE